MEKINHSESNESNNFKFETLLKYVYGKLDDSEIAKKIVEEREKSFKLHMTLTDIEHLQKNNKFSSFEEHKDWLQKSKEETWENLKTLIDETNNV